MFLKYKEKMSPGIYGQLLAWNLSGGCIILLSLMAFPVSEPEPGLQLGGSKASYTESYFKVLLWRFPFPKEEETSNKGCPGEFHH